MSSPFPPPCPCGRVFPILPPCSPCTPWLRAFLLLTLIKRARQDSPCPLAQAEGRPAWVAWSFCSQFEAAAELAQVRGLPPPGGLRQYRTGANPAGELPKQAIRRCRDTRPMGQAALYPSTVLWQTIVKSRTGVRSDKNKAMTDYTALPRCTLTRRLAVIAYDFILLFGVLFIASLIALPFTGDDPQRAHHPLFTSYLFFVAFFFFGWFWTHGGQTLGMRAWRVRVVRHDNGGPITWWQALLRFLVAIASWLVVGVGFLWSLFDKEKRAWHDIYSESTLVVLPKKVKE